MARPLRLRMSLRQDKQQCSDEGWDDVATPKVLTITLEFEIGEERIGTTRLRAAHRAAISAAINAVKAEIQAGNVAVVRHRVTWDYRWTDIAGQETIVADQEMDDDVEELEWDESELDQ